MKNILDAGDATPRRKDSLDIIDESMYDAGVQNMSYGFHQEIEARAAMRQGSKMLKDSQRHIEPEGSSTGSGAAKPTYDEPHYHTDAQGYESMIRAIADGVGSVTVADVLLDFGQEHYNEFAKRFAFYVGNADPKTTQFKAGAKLFIEKGHELIDHDKDNSIDIYAAESKMKTFTAFGALRKQFTMVDRVKRLEDEVDALKERMSAQEVGMASLRQELNQKEVLPLKEQVVTLKQQGMTDTAIAVQVGKSRRTVFNILKEAGMK